MTFGVSLPANRDPDSAVYNFKTPWGIAEEHAGLSVFALEDGLVLSHLLVLCAAWRRSTSLTNCSTVLPTAATRSSERCQGPRSGAATNMIYESLFRKLLPFERFATNSTIFAGDEHGNLRATKSLIGVG